MKYSDFIIEKVTSNELSYNSDTINKIKSECKIAIDQYKKGNIIYRGMPITDEVSYGDSSTFNRKSRNTTNEYTLLMDNLPSWKKYPKRSKSWICTGKKFKSYQYGNTYVVLPIGNPDIGVCTDVDVWLSFWQVFSELRIEMMNEFNEQLVIIIDKISEEYPEIEDLDYDTNWNDFKQCCAVIKKSFSPDMLEWFRNKRNYLYEYLYYKNNVLVGLNSLMNPSKNGFKLSPLSSLKLKDNEIWFSGPAYFIREDIVYNHFNNDFS